MRKLFLLFIVFQLAVKVSYSQGTEEYKTINRSYEMESMSAPDSLNVQYVLKMPDVNRAGNIKLPYPIIFIHGLNSNSGTWNITTNWMDQQYGLTYGGRMDVCLNYDGNNYSSNSNYYPTTGADVAPFTPTLKIGDYYYLNFDVSINGAPFPYTWDSDYVLSEQSSVVKQALGLRYAIYKVLKETGRDKVVLMTHSMGGLAAREYLQNQYHWQSDGKTHVAKLVTIGTPHGGSNTSSFGTGIGGVDEQSEAVRDLRKTYYYSGDPGVFLFGGIELQDNDVHMNDNINLSGYDFYTVDVNCNGNDGDNVVGLNTKNIYTNIDYACIIGICSGCVIDASIGDGIVNSFSANLNNFYNIGASEFKYYGSAVTEIHTDLPKQYYEIMQGLDVSPYYSTAYGIEFNKSYIEFITMQPSNGFPFDYDDFKFVKSGDGQFTLNISDISFPDLMVRILDKSQNVVGSVKHSSGSSGLTLSRYLTAGVYYLEIFVTPTSSSYLYPYKFNIQETVTSVEENSYNNQLSVDIYPNPVEDYLIIRIDGNTELSTIVIFDITGNEVMRRKTKSLESRINVAELGTGVYIVRIESGNQNTINKKIIVH